MTTQDLSGLIINNRYYLLGVIGAGGMATVYEALDRELDKRVAVKILNREWRSDEEQVARFRQEARTAARVRHPHLVDVTDRGITDDGIPFLVMELLEGKSLAQELADHPGPLPWRRAVDLAVQACGALAAAHDAGLVHRDIKPGNCFLVTRPGQGVDFLKVLDLGIAKIVRGPRDPHAPPSTRVDQGTPGTPEYMAPEQTTGEPIGPACDVYALGVMLFRMLTGVLPFVTSPGDPDWKIFEMHARLPPPQLRVFAPAAGIPDSIAQIVLRCLAKRPEERWSSAAELAAALQAAESVECPAPVIRVPETGVVTAFFHPREPTRSLPRALFRGLVGFQAMVLFMLIVMSLAIVDLPGVEAVANGLRTEGASARSLRPVQGRLGDETRTDREVAEPREPAHVRSPAAADSGRAEDVPPTPLSGREEKFFGSPRPSGAPAKKSKRAGNDVPDPFAEQAKKSAAKGAGGSAGAREPGASKSGAAPEVLVQVFLDGRGSLFKRCRSSFAMSVTYIVDLQLAAGSGQVTNATLRSKRRPEADQCVQETLLKLKIAAVKQGGVFPGMKVKL